MDTFKEGKVITDADMAASFESDQLSVLAFNGYFLQLTFTGSPVGSAKIQVSADEMGVPSGSSTWSTLDDSTVAITESGSISYNVSKVKYGKIKFVYTRTSGTGTLQGKLIRKN